LLFVTSLYSDTKVYLGANYGLYDENFDNVKATSSTNIASMKIGYGDIKTYSVELSFDYIPNKSKIFSSSNTTSDGDKYNINIEFVKSFDFDIKILPFIKAGFGSGSLKIERELQNVLSFGSFNLGTGIFIPINNTYDIEIGYNYRNISYEAIDTIVNKIQSKSNVNIAYMGFNIRF
jgi:hypothetical protein